jgi:calcineurin-like phosphoesterase family protein
MNEHIIKRWNEVVNKKDVTYLLGDVSMESKNFYYLLDRLNGVINVILGNHDRRQDIPELLKYVNSVAGMIDFKGDYILTHCPVHPSQLEFRYSYNIHGHVHENSLEDPRYINVSCEVVDYTPKLITELI